MSIIGAMKVRRPSRWIAAVYVLVWLALLVLLMLEWRALAWGWRVLAGVLLGITAPALGDLRDVFRPPGNSDGQPTNSDLSRR